jgi:hypothetical protein
MKPDQLRERAERQKEAFDQWNLGLEEMQSYVAPLFCPECKNPRWHHQQNNNGRPFSIKIGWPTGDSKLAPRVSPIRRFWAWIRGKKGEWISMSQTHVPFGMPCDVPNCGKAGIWDIHTGWLCKTHKAPRILTEVQKAYPSVGVNGPSIFYRNPQPKDQKKAAWAILLSHGFGLVELPGWIG